MTATVVVPNPDTHKRAPSRTLAVWSPQPGPQTYAATCPVDVIFFGGERGGGKSDCIIGRQVTGSMRYGNNWNGLVVRRKFKDLAELRRRIDQLISEGLPAIRSGGEQQENIVKFDNGAQFKLTAINRPELLDDYQGHQYTEIDIDEATNFPFILKMIDKFKGCLRSAAGVPCKLFLSGNPGGPGHVAIKSTFITPNPSGMEVFYDDAGDSYIFIPSGLKDNQILCKGDPKYVRRLQSIKDPMLRRAWLEGDWDAFIGQAFTFSTRYHMIDPISPRDDQPVYMTFDWGYGKPFSIGWWFVDSDNRVVRFNEWYGCEAGMPDTGMRLTDTKIAEGILEREIKMGITNRGHKIRRLSGPDCFSKKPDYKGGGQGPSTAEVFATMQIFLTKGDPTRDQKIRQFRERLDVPELEENGERPLPMMVVTSNCKDFIRTIPALAMDENKPEDIDSSQEDHCFAGSTLVDTGKGLIPIRDLVGSVGIVLTAGGYWTWFYDCRMTRKNAQVVRVTFEDGRSIVCTGDHKFYTKTNGYVEAIGSLDESCHVSICVNRHINMEDREWMSSLSTKPHRNSTANDTGCVASTTKEKDVEGYMSRCGYTTMVRLRMVITSTIKTMTGAITNLTTCRPRMVLRTFPTMARSATPASGKKLCGTGLLFGMAVKKERLGTKSNTRKTAKGRFTLKRQTLSASSAVKRLLDILSRSFAQEDVSSGSGSLTAESQRFVSSVGETFLGSELLVQKLVQQEKHGESAKVIKVEPFGEEDVYCLTAAGTHAFCIEGGVLVHNCYDEACHIVMARPFTLVDDPNKAKDAYAKRIDELNKPPQAQDPLTADEDISPWEKPFHGDTISTMDDDDGFD